MQTKNNEKNGDKFIEEIVKATEEDFERRLKERKPLERQWELNMNFLVGNQYCGFNGHGEVTDYDKDFYWQGREVYNHIAPLIETRLAKFSKVSPSISIRPKTDDDNDISSAKLCEKLIENAFTKAKMKETVERVTVWSETCGTGFYKIVWDNSGGNKVGELDGDAVYEGDVKIIPVSPFEIFPDSLYNENIEDCFSIIHARAVPVRVIKEKYGKVVKGEKVGVFNLALKKSDTAGGSIKNTLIDSAIVIEKYEKPSSEFPNGRLITVAGGKLLYYGELPYKIGKNDTRTFPFIRQESINIAGGFFGASIIERLIPVQRALNAVKNRKHEFLNRLSMGIMTVEDGSVDVEDLENEGLPPGKVLVYRQGSTAPEMMQNISMPTDFSDEEEKLVGEFVTVSGIADVSSSSINTKIASASALQILVEQDNERLVATSDKIRKCYLETAVFILRLYKEFTTGVRVITETGNNNRTKVFYADKSVFNSDEVYIQSENELTYSENQKKEMLFKLYESGIITEKDGSIRPSTKEKLLSLLGYKDLDGKKGVARLQEEKAQNENITIREYGLGVEIIDDDIIHIDEHTRYILSEYEELTEDEKQRLFAHIREHKNRIKEVI